MGSGGIAALRIAPQPSLNMLRDGSYVMSTQNIKRIFFVVENKGSRFFLSCALASIETFSTSENLQAYIQVVYRHIYRLFTGILGLQTYLNLYFTDKYQKSFFESLLFFNRKQKPAEEIAGYHSY